MLGKILWVSRHPLDPEAESFLRLETDSEGAALETREILWPSDEEGCAEVLCDLVAEGITVLAGVFPAQAVELFCTLNRAVGAREPLEDLFSGKPGGLWVAAPVSEPIREPDTGKVRSFRFVRWAFLGRFSLPA